MLVEFAIGDAFGSGFEFKPQDFVDKHNDGKTYYASKFGMGAGQYTDDTQMALALTEFMLSKKPITALNLADAFVSTFKRDPRQGYAPGFQQVLNEVNSGLDFLRVIQPHSNKSGGAMRALPCAYLSTPEKVRDKAMWQASLTHATKEGMESAAFVALLGFFCRQGVPLANLAGCVRDYLSMDIKAWWDDGRVGNLGMEVARAAYTAVIDCKGSMSSVLTRSVSYGGDTDTVAAIAMGIASLHPEIINNNDLPRELYDNLEDGDYGYIYLQQLDNQLDATFPVPKLRVAVDPATLFEVLKPKAPEDPIIYYDDPIRLL